MLRVLHLENWKSFHEPVDFSMIAGRGTRHNETLALNGKRDVRILPIAAIYGANAAGKSALLDAVHLLQQLVSEPRARGRRLPYNPHKLYGVGEPTVLGVEIVLDVPDPTASREAVVYYEVAYTADHCTACALPMRKPFFFVMREGWSFLVILMMMTLCRRSLGLSKGIVSY